MFLGQPDDYHQLTNPEPNNPGEHCTEFWGSHDRKWNDASCAGKHYFVCECNPDENHDGQPGYCTGYYEQLCDAFVRSAHYVI